MPKELTIAIIVSMLLFIIYVLRNVKKDKLSVGNAIIWFILSIGVIIATFQIDNLKKMAKFIGIETVSNMLFFLGFIFLIFVCFNITKNISKQNKKIIELTQELALLSKKVDNTDEEKR